MKSYDRSNVWSGFSPLFDEYAKVWFHKKRCKKSSPNRRLRTIVAVNIAVRTNVQSIEIAPEGKGLVLLFILVNIYKLVLKMPSRVNKNFG